MSVLPELVAPGDPELEDDFDPEPEEAVITVREPQGVTWARLFVAKFKPRFDEAAKEKAEKFRLPIADFDEFIVECRLVEDCAGLPDKKDPALWNLFTTKRNKIRGGINSAASIGRHGEPPFSIDTPKTDTEIRSEPTRRNKKGDLKEVRRKRTVRTYYEVNLVAGLARITHKDAVATVKSLLKTKVKGFEAHSKMYAKHWHTLPLPIQFTLEQQQAEVDMVSETVGGMLNRLLIRIQENHERATMFLERAKVEEENRAKALGMDSPGDV